MRHRCLGIAWSCTLCGGFIFAGFARADVFYVEATIANTEGAVSGADDWFSGDDGSTGGTPANGSTSTDNLWRFRVNQGSGAGIWEVPSSSSAGEDAPMIKTAVTDAPNGMYDVYVFYRSQAGADNWNIRAGLDAGSLNLYDRTGADGIAGSPAFSGTAPLLDFVPGTAPTEDTGQPLYYAVIGQANVMNGTLSVFVDDFPTSSLSSDFLNKRSWYDGIGYFTTGGLTFIDSVMTGLASSASTWSNNQPPSSGNNYRVVSGHTVTVDGPFAGDQLHAASGGTVDFNNGGNGVHIPLLVVDTGGSLTETASGDFALGDINAATLGTLQLDDDVSFPIDAGTDFFLDMIVLGSGNMDFNSGAGSNLWLTATQGHLGTIRFNGSGDQVKITESQGIGNLEMNSTGANTLFYDPLVQATSGMVTFNQPGTIDHASTSTTPLRRLHGMNVLVANAPITVDLTKGFPDDSTQTDERRFLVGTSAAGTGIHGSADITVNGMSFDPTSGTAIGLNEFEVGSTGEPGTVATSTYSGTLTANDYVNLEMRQNFPDGKFVINNRARLEIGHQAVPNTESIEVGAVEVNSGGILEVGFEEAEAGSPFFAGTGHHAYHLTLTGSGSRDGTLTLSDGATLRMQVNGTAADQFDSIAADGNVMLNGTLEVLVNPPSTTATANPVYTPTLGDTFDIITIASASPSGDYDGNGSVGPEDYAAWQAAFGTNSAAADGNSNGVVDAADYVVWRDNEGQVGGTVGAISGTFDNVTINDPTGALAGFNFQVNYSATAVQLEVVAAGLGAGVVPEPSTLALMGLLLPALAIRRRRPRPER